MEKRKYQRIRKRWLVKLNSGSNCIQSFTGDVSKEGIFVVSTKLFPPGAVLKVEISAGAGKLNLGGRVMWGRSAPVSQSISRKGGMGLQIENDSESSLQSLLEKN